MPFCQLLSKRRLAALSSSPRWSVLARATLCASSLKTNHNGPDALKGKPKAKFPGKCVLITHPDTQEMQHENLIRSLCADTKVLGFDTETKPSFLSGGRIQRPCLVQLASEQLCVMWRLRIEGKPSNYSGTDFPPLLGQLLSSKDILKVGHGAREDALGLLEHYGVHVHNVMDTYVLINSLDFNLGGGNMKVLASTLLRLSLDKKSALSNWEKKQLSKRQMDYACTDAWISLLVYKSLVSLAERKGLTILPPIMDFQELLEKKLRRKEQRAHILRMKKLKSEPASFDLAKEDKLPPRRHRQSTRNAPDVASHHTLHISSTSSLKKLRTRSTKRTKFMPTNSNTMKTSVSIPTNDTTKSTNVSTSTCDTKRTDVLGVSWLTQLKTSVYKVFSPRSKSKNE